jgi:hypothetical protein
MFELSILNRMVSSRMMLLFYILMFVKWMKEMIDVIDIEINCNLIFAWFVMFGKVSSQSFRFCCIVILALKILTFSLFLWSPKGEHIVAALSVRPSVFPSVTKLVRTTFQKLLVQSQPNYRNYQYQV